MNEFLKIARHKENARIYITKLKNERALFVPDNCSNCNAICKPHAHHPDYNEPDNIMWLCHSCHVKIHIGDKYCKRMIKVDVKTEVLLRILAKRNMSQNELARLCGITSGFISQLLSGQRKPSPEIRQKIMDVLNIKNFDLIFKI
jgi:ribosome-binding protein aMBF1 (putative translation factor)